MPRGNDRNKRAPRAKELGRRGGKKKPCVFCKERLWVDYKDVNLLRRFQSDRGKIRARRVTGNCTQHHREVAVAIKTARELALLPYLQRTVVERAGGRSLRVGGGERGRSGPPRTAAESEGVAPEASLAPEVVAELEGVEPDAVVPEVVVPDAVVPDAVVPEVVEPELAES